MIGWLVVWTYHELILDVATINVSENTRSFSVEIIKFRMKFQFLIHKTVLLFIFLFYIFIAIQSNLFLFVFDVD